jgi:uncharacterized protein YcbX
MLVESLAVAPVKGLGLNHPEAVQVTDVGVWGDRRYALVDARGNLANGKRFGPLVRVRASISDDPESLELEFPDGSRVAGQVELGEPVTTVFYGKERPAHVVLGDYSQALSQVAGEPLRLVRLADGGAIDRVGVGSVSLQSTASLATLGRETGTTVDGRRFRMTFTISGAQEHAEDDWIGRRIRIGDAVIVPEGNIGRCVVTSQDPDTGITNLDTLKTLARYRGMIETTEDLPFGIHARVVTPGRVAVGDTVVVEED